jgi:hypothetical protein
MSPFPCRSCQARRSFRHEEALVAASGLGASADNGAGFSAFKRHAVDHAWILRLASEGDEDSMEASSPDFQLKWSLSARLPLFEHRSNFNDELPKRHATSLAALRGADPRGFCQCCSLSVAAAQHGPCVHTWGPSLRAHRSCQPERDLGVVVTGGAHAKGAHMIEPMQPEDLAGHESWASPCPLHSVAQLEEPRFN